MKKLMLLPLLLMSFIPIGGSQTMNWQWVNVETAPSGTGAISADRVVTDASGNVYVYGIFGGPTVSFGAFTLTNNSTFGELFLVKYDPAGNVIWAASAGGTASEYPSGLAIDGNGNLYITGVFYSPAATFGNITITNSSPGFGSVYIAKYSSSGTAQWAIAGNGGGAETYGSAITVDANNHIYMGGAFSGSNLGIGSLNLINSGTGWDVFIAKLDASGNVISAFAAGGSQGSESLSDLAVDANGGIIFCGDFQGTFGIGNQSVPSAGLRDVYVAKYSDGGSFQWSRTAGGNRPDYLHTLVTDASGNIYAGGAFESNSLTIQGTTLTNSSQGSKNVNLSNSQDWLLVKIDPSGSVLWAKSGGGSGHESIKGISAKIAGKLTFTGSFRSSSISFGNTLLTNSGLGSLFVAQFDAAGLPVTAVSAGGDYFTSSRALATDPNGNIFICGSSSSTVFSFGNLVFNSGTTADKMIMGKITVTCPIVPSPVATALGSNLSTAAGQGTYQWYLNGNTIAGASANTYTATASGNYHVVVTNSNGCSGASNTLNITVSGGGKGPKKKELSASGPSITSIYPNPVTNGTFFIQLAGNKSPKMLRVLNMQGAVVKKQNIEADETVLSVDMATQTAGVYVVEITYEEEIVVERLMFQ